MLANLTVGLHCIPLILSVLYIYSFPIRIILTKISMKFSKTKYLENFLVTVQLFYCYTYEKPYDFLIFFSFISLFSGLILYGNQIGNILVFALCTYKEYDLTLSYVWFFLYFAIESIDFYDRSVSSRIISYIYSFGYIGYLFKSIYDFTLTHEFYFNKLVGFLANLPNLHKSLL